MEKLEYYTITPNLKQIYGKKVDNSTEFEDKTEDGRVTQTFKDLTLITKIHSENEQGPYKIVEDSQLTATMPEGTILLWSEFDGWFIPSAQVCTLDDLKEEINAIQSIYEEDNNDTKGNEN